MPTTDALVAALRERGLTVHDRRGQLAQHPTKRFAARDPEALLGLVVHHSAGPTGGLERVEAVARYHVGPNHVSASGCPGILYTLAITDEGEVVLCHDLGVATWSQGYKARPGDENAEFLAVLVVGDFASPGHSGAEPTPEQVYAVAAIMVAARKLWGRTFDLLGHYALGKPACPGATLEGLVRALRSHVEPAQASAELDTLLDVQRALHALGYDPGALDGLDGPRTRSAICTFQRDHGLTVDGIAGPATRRKLAAELG